MLTSTGRTGLFAAGIGAALLTSCGDLPVSAPQRTASPSHAEAAAASAMQADIARLRNAPRTGGTSLGRGTTAADMAEYLERFAPGSGTRYSYDMFMLNGASAVYPTGGSAPGTRTVEVNAWTHCTGCVSASTETGGDVRIVFVQNGTNYPHPRRFSNLSPYSSGMWYFSVSGARVDASVFTEHYANYAWNKHTRRSSAVASL